MWTPMKRNDFTQITANRMGEYHCPGCGYSYDESLGDDHEGYPPGMKFEDLPDDFVCPACSVRYKEDFVPDKPECTLD